MALVLDTGVILALLNANDRHHQACVELATGTNEPLIVPAATLAELDYWVRKVLGVRTWQTFVEDVGSGAYLLEQTTETDLVRSAELELQYEELKLGFVDARSSPFASVWESPRSRRLTGVISRSLSPAMCRFSICFHTGD